MDPLLTSRLCSIHVAASLIWIISVIFLGLGGLVREKAVGSSTFTLALPVGRTKFVAVRSAVVFLEALTLAVVPWVVNFAISSIRQTPFSFGQALCCILLLMAGGAVCFCLAILVSSMVEGEYTAAAVAYGLVIFSLFLAESVPQLREMNLIYLVTGLDYVDKRTFVFLQPLPWVKLWASFSLGMIMLLVSAVIIKKKDF